MTAGRRRHPVRTKRGTALLLFSFVFALAGVALLARESGPIPPHYTVLVRIAPLKVWGVAWLGASFVACVQAWSRPRLESPWAFGSLAAISFVWTAALVAGAAITTTQTAGAAAMQWALVTVLLVHVAGWPNPPEDLPPGTRNP